MTSVEGEWLAELGPMFYVVKDRGGSSANAKAAAAAAAGSARAASNPLLAPYTPTPGRMLRSERHAAAMREMSAMEEEMQRAGELDEDATRTTSSVLKPAAALIAPPSERRRRNEIVTPGRSARSEPASTSSAVPAPTPEQSSVRERIRSSLRAKFEEMTPSSASGAVPEEGNTPGTA